MMRLTEELHIVHGTDHPTRVLTPAGVAVGVILLAMLITSAGSLFIAVIRSLVK